MKFKTHCIIVTALATIAIMALPLGHASAGSNTESSQKPVATEQVAVNWEAARKHPRLEMAKLSEQQKQAVERSAVPVLLPDQDELLAAAVITTGPGWYAASMAQDKFSAALSGNRKVIRIPGAPQPPHLGDPTLKPSKDGGMLEVSFMAFGVYYDLSLECFDHGDPRCSADPYAIKLLQSLKLALVNEK